MLEEAATKTRRTSGSCRNSDNFGAGALFLDGLLQLHKRKLSDLALQSRITLIPSSKDSNKSPASPRMARDFRQREATLLCDTPRNKPGGVRSLGYLIDPQRAFAVSASPSVEQVANRRATAKPLTEHGHAAGTASSVNQAQLACHPISCKTLFPTRHKFQMVPAKGQQRQNLEIWFFCVGPADGRPGLHTHTHTSTMMTAAEALIRGHGEDEVVSRGYSLLLLLTLNIRLS